jgi:hypothetical protein
LLGGVEHFVNHVGGVAGKVGVRGFVLLSRLLIRLGLLVGRSQEYVRQNVERAFALEGGVSAPLGVD